MRTGFIIKCGIIPLIKGEKKGGFMEKKVLGLSFIWGIRLGFRAEGNKLWAEGDKFWAESKKLRAEGNKLWAESDKLCAESNKFCAEGNKLWAEGDKFWAESNKLRAEGDKLRAEGDKLWAEGDKFWAEAILQVYGNIKMKWKNYNSNKNDYECHLETEKYLNRK